MTGQKDAKIVYRRNDVLDNYVNNIANALRSRGYNAELVGFDRQNFDESFEAWRENNRSSLENSYLVSDNTSENKISSKSGKEVDENIDSLLFQALYRKVFPENVRENFTDDEGNPEITSWGNKSLEGFSDEEKSDKVYEAGKLLYSSMIKEMLGSEVPNKAYFCPKKSLAHEPFMEVQIDPRFEGSDQAKLDYVSKCFSEIFENAGIKNYGLIEDPYSIKNYDFEGNWIFADRHLTSRYEISTKNAKLMELPFENLYQSALDYGLLKSSGVGNELEKIVSERIEKNGPGN